MEICRSISTEGNSALVRWSPLSEIEDLRLAIGDGAFIARLKDGRGLKVSGHLVLGWRAQ